MTRNENLRRPGYTLIELLVVIAIIALLVSLTIPAVMKVLSTGPRTQTLYELTKMQESLQAAEQAYSGIQYLPSKLVLYNYIPNYKTTTDNDAKTTATVLQAMFGRRFLQYGQNVTWDGTTFSGTPPDTRQFVLEGDQCLVFYLGGMQGTLGFSKNPVDPTQAGGERIGPFYTFSSSRLVQRGTNNQALNFFSYKDPYGTPYAFFGTNGSLNAYYDYCPTLQSGGVHPYGSGGQYQNPSTFQIISAGPDKNFGSGGASWSPTSGATDKPTTDNMANFSRSMLAAPKS